MWSGGGWFCEDRKDWSAECSSWCICCWTCECDNCGTSWRAGKFFHWFFNSASMQWYFKFREPATNGEMKVDVAVAYLWIIWFLFDLSFSNGIMTWSGSWVTVFIGIWKWQFFFTLSGLISDIKGTLHCDGGTYKFSKERVDQLPCDKFYCGLGGIIADSDEKKWQIVLQTDYLPESLRSSH